MTATSSTTRHVRRERIASTATNRRHLATRKPASCGKKGSATIAPARCATWRSKSPVRQRRASGRTNRAAVVSHIACSSTRHRNHRPPQAIRPQRAAWCPRWRRPRLLPVELRPLRPEQRPTWCTRLPRRSSWTTTMLPYCPASSKEVKRGNRRAERSFFFCKERMIRIPVFFACGGRRLAYAAPFGSRYVFFAFLEPFRFACPAPPHLFGSTSPKTKNCKLIYEILQRYVGTGTPNATPLGSAIGFVVALSNIWN